MLRIYRAIGCLAKGFATGLSNDRRGQDLVEYALMAASVAVVAGVFFPPSVMPTVSTIFSRVVAIFNQAP